VDELQTTIWTGIWFRGLASPFGVASHCPYHCCARVAQKIRGIQTYRCLHLPQCFHCSSYNVPDPSEDVAGNYRYRSRSLPDSLSFARLIPDTLRKLTGHFCCWFYPCKRPDTARADGGHAPPLGLLSKTFSLTFILPSLLVRFSVLSWIKPHAAPLVVLPRLFL
jgi:hypothetical protein